MEILATKLFQLHAARPSEWSRNSPEFIQLRAETAKNLARQEASQSDHHPASGLGESHTNGTSLPPHRY